MRNPRSLILTVQLLKNVGAPQKKGWRVELVGAKSGVGPEYRKYNLGKDVAAYIGPNDGHTIKVSTNFKVFWLYARQGNGVLLGRMVDEFGNNKGYLPKYAVFQVAGLGNKLHQSQA